MEILVATNNQKKLREINDILGTLIPDLKLYTLRDVGFDHYRVALCGIANFCRFTCNERLVV